MIGWLIYDEKQYEKNAWFAGELIKNCNRFCELKLIIVEKLDFGIYDNDVRFLYDGRPEKKPGFAICRTIFPMLSFFLENNGIRVFNSYSVSQFCNDKRYTYAVLLKTGIPIMNTSFFDKRFFNPQRTETRSFPCVLKSADGHGGSEVFLVNDKKSYSECLGSIPSDGFLDQSVCKTTGKDVRVYVMGNQILAAVLRSSSGFRSNFSLGGSAETYALSAREEKTVYTVLESLPFSPDFVGIDFLLDNGRFVFNEIEDVVGCRMLYATTNTDVADRFAKYIEANL